METKPIDKITLADALTIPVWKMVWAGEPTREIEVRMTYEDLKIICDLVQEMADKRKTEK